MAIDFKRLMLEQAQGKAIPAHPALQDRDIPTSVYAPGTGGTVDAKLTQREASRHLDAYGGKQAIDWVMDCVDLYAGTTSAAEWHLERDGKRLFNERTEETPDDAEIAPKELVSLLESPNPFQDYAELVELLIIDLLLVGNAYWLKWRMPESGRPLALYRLAPAYVTVVPDKFGPKYYEYKPPGVRDALKISLEEIVHLRRPNPHSAFYGMGVIKGGGRPFDLELALTDSMATYYENRADPSLIVQSERRVPRDVFKKLWAQLRARTTGRKYGDLLVLEAGLKATSLSPTARDALFDTLTGMSRDRIFAMFGAHPKLFGIDSGGSGSDKVQDVRREFSNHRLRPFLDKLQRRITAGLVAAWGLDFVIDYHYVMPQEDLVKLIGDFAGIPGIKVKEIRKFAQPLGIVESTGDADIDDMVLNIPGEEQDASGQPVSGDAAFADERIGSEAGRPPIGGSSKAFPKGGAPLPAGAKVRRPRQGKALSDDIDDISRRLTIVGDQARIEGKAVNLETQSAGIGSKLPAERRPTDTLEPKRDADISALVAAFKPVLDDAAHVLERGLLDHVDGKALGDGLGARIRKSESWKTFSATLTGALENLGVRAISTAAIDQGSVGVLPEDELDYEEIARSIVHRPEGATSIRNTLRDEVIAKVGKAQREGKDRQEVEQVVREVIDFWRTTQAETILLTEAVESYNEGTLSALESAGDEDTLVADGRDHDEPCVEADGSVWPIAYAREHRLQHPRCRRVFMRVPA